jgi:hypothetical protein
MLAERRIGADGSPENDARFVHGRGDDVRIVAFLRRALVEEVAVSAQASRAAFIEGTAIA